MKRKLDKHSRAGMTRIGLAVVLAAVVLLSACSPVPGATEPGSSPAPLGGQQQPAASTDTAVSPPAGAEPMRTPKHTPEPVPGKGGLQIPETPVVGEVPDEILQLIYADIANQYNVDVSGLQLLRAQQVIWPDGSLGCPEPGQMYTMALVDGYWIQVQIGDEVYDYRATQQGTFKRCNSDKLPGLPVGGTPTE